MFIYIVWLCVGIISVLISIYMKKFSRFYYVLYFLLSFFIISLRKNVGADYPTYQYTFENNQYDGYEIGFRFLIDVFKSLHLGFYTFIFFIALITYLFFYYFASRTSNRSLALFAFNSISIDAITSTIRQGVTVPLVGISIYFMDNKVIFILVVLLASLFHPSSLILLLLYPFLNKKYSMKQIFVFILLSIIIYQSNIVGYLIYNTPIFELAFFSEFKVYFYASKYQTTMSFLAMTYKVVFLALFLYFYKYILNNKVSVRFFNLFLFTVLLSIIFYDRSVFTTRIIYNLNISLVFLISYLSSCLKGKHKVLFIIISMAFAIAFFGSEILFVERGGMNVKAYLPYDIIP